MRAGSPHVFERVRANGQVIEMRGQPLPGGGYVTSYNDITDFKRAEQALREANETLGERASSCARTRPPRRNQSRTRFLAASATTCCSRSTPRACSPRPCATADGEPGEQRRLAERVDASLRAAEELLDGLLDISRARCRLAASPRSACSRLDELLRQRGRAVRAAGGGPRPALRACTAARCRCAATAACCAARCRTSSPTRCATPRKAAW